MKRIFIWLALGGLFLLASCATGESVSSPTSSSVVYTLTPSSTSVFYTPMPTSTPEVTPATPTITPTPFYQMSEMDHYADLFWLECEVSSNLYHRWPIAGKCFSLLVPSWQDEDRALFGEKFLRVSSSWADIRNTINGDVYETEKQADWLYILYKNGGVFAQSMSGFTTYSPNRSLLEVDGKVVWELATPGQPTIIFDGQDLLQEYNLEAAYFPYALNDRLIFVAKRDSKYVVLYDGEQIGPVFDEISIGYCCGPAGYAPKRAQGQYWFWGVRENRYYAVAIGVDE